MSRGLKISDLIEADPAPTSSDDDSESFAGWSLTSSVTDYVYENGRRYPGVWSNVMYSFGPDGVYLYPNDDRENERLDLQHHIFRLLKGGDLHTIPNPKFHRVLDVGTGTGIWAIDFADEFPEARIRGVDLSPTQPEWVPENVLFEIDDLEQTWNFTSPFDYIHMRMMLGSIANWPKLIKQAYENLAPGGWLESQEVLTHAYCDDGTLPPDCNWKKWEKLYVDAARSFGRPIDIAMELKGWYEDAGFVDVVEDVVKCPLGNWPADRGQKENGRYLRTSLSEGLQALSLAIFTRVLNWKPDEVEALIALCRNDLINRSYHGYFKFYFVRGRKPFPKPIQAPPPAVPSQAPTQTPRYDGFDFRSSTSTLGSTSGSGSTVTTSDRIFTEYQPMGFQPPNPVAAPPPPPPPPSAPAPSIVAPMNEPYMERRSMDFTAVERQPAEPRPMDLAPTDRTLTERRSMDYSPMDRTPVERRSMDLAPTDRPSIEQLPVNPPSAQRPPAERRSMDIPPLDRRPFDFSRP